MIKCKFEVVQVLTLPEYCVVQILNEMHPLKKYVYVFPVKDVRANCFCASLLRT